MSTIDLAASPGDLRALAEQSNAWPFEQAKAIVARLKKSPKDEVLFETGYGPSGLPHIGTFGEVARTTMVRHAFRVLTEDKIKTRLLAFSDDMDGLRKVPDNVPNKEMLAAHLGKPLTRVPDPFSQRIPVVRRAQQCAAARVPRHLRLRLRIRQLDRLLHVGQVRRGAAAHAGAARRGDGDHAAVACARSARATYSPFLPICPRTGVVLYVPIVAHDVKAGTVSYDDPETKERVTLPVTGGHCKLQWKPDWAMRWFALGVDYEMAGKDLIDSVKLSGKICAALGGTPPEGFNYELFLDDKGQKISKSKGNGLTIDEWLRYASPESLSLFMYREPKSAKRLYFDVIPRNVDDYQQFLDGFSRQDAQAAARQSGLAYPFRQSAEGRHARHVPAAADAGVVVERGECRDAVGFHRPLSSRRDAADPSEARCDGRLRHQLLSRLRGADQKIPRADRQRTRRAAGSARCAVEHAGRRSSAEDIQNVVYEIGRREPFLDPVKKGKDGRPGVSLDWFNMLYQVLLGQEKGPRFGSFVAVYGVPNAVAMIDGALARSA